MNDTTFKLRVPTAELERWREQAKGEGKALAEWIRARCMGDSVVAATGRSKAVHESKPDNHPDSSRKPVRDRIGQAACKHGALPSLCRYEECRK